MQLCWQIYVGAQATLLTAEEYPDGWMGDLSLWAPGSGLAHQCSGLAQLIPIHAEGPAESRFLRVQLVVDVKATGDSPCAERIGSVCCMREQRILQPDAVLLSGVSIWRLG